MISIASSRSVSPSASGVRALAVTVDAVREVLPLAPERAVVRDLHDVLGRALLIALAAAQHARRVAHVRVGELDAQLRALAVDGKPLVPPLVQRADADLERARHAAGVLEHREQLRVRARVREEHALGRAADRAQHGEVVACRASGAACRARRSRRARGRAPAAMRCCDVVRARRSSTLLRHVVAAHLGVELGMPVEAPREVVHVQRADALERRDLARSRARPPGRTASCSRSARRARSPRRPRRAGAPPAA